MCTSFIADCSVDEMNCDLVPCRMSTPLLRDWMARSAEPQADRSTVPPIPSPIGRARHAKARAKIPNDFFNLHEKNGHG